MTYLTFPALIGTDLTSAAVIAEAVGAISVTFLGDRSGKTVLLGQHADGCRTAILLMDNGDGTVRAWPETDLGNIGWHASADRHDQRWFLDLADLDILGTGCESHTSAHWRAEHLHAAPVQVLAA